MEPDVVIFDEPDSGLDPVRTALLCELIQEMHGIHKGTYIVVTHNIASARQIGEYIARAVERAHRRSGRRRAHVLLRQRLRPPVPQRIRRGPADDGLSVLPGRRRSAPRGRASVLAYANICSYGRMRPPAPFRAGRSPPGERAALVGRALAIAPPQRARSSASGKSRARPRRMGVRRGMALGEALARCPDLVLVPARSRWAWQEAWEPLLRCAGGDRRGRRVGAARPGLLRDRARCAALHGTDAAVIAPGARRRARSQGAAVRPCRRQRRSHVARADPLLRAGGGAGGALAPSAGARGRATPCAGSPARPVELLGYRAETEQLLEPLERLGVRTLGELARLGRAALADRFGAAGALRAPAGLRRGHAAAPAAGARSAWRRR